MNKLSTFAIVTALTASTLFGAGDFFSSDHDPAAELPGDKVYPAGKIFPFSGFQPASVAATVKDGYTVAGPAYGGRIPIVLEEAAKLGVPVIYPVNAKGVSLKSLSDKNAKPDWEAIKSDLARQVKAAAARYPNIAWWYLQPEELRYWRANEFNYLKTAYAAIKEADPLKRPVWMYIPNHYDAAALKRYVPHMDIIGKGMYVNYSDNAESRAWVRLSSDSQTDAVQGSDAVAICVPEMFQNQPVEKIPARVRHDVYLSLIRGSKGVVVFSLAERPTMDKAVHQEYWKAYSKIAGELKSLGPVFLFGENRSDVKLEQLSGPAAQTVKLTGKKASVEVPVLSFADKIHPSGRYLFVANSAEAPVGCRFTGLPPAKILDAVSGAEVGRSNNGAFDTELRPLEVKLFKVVRP